MYTFAFLLLLVVYSYGQVICPLTQSPSQDCTDCGSFVVPIPVVGLCQPPTPTSCAQTAKIFCPATESCADDCSSCGAFTQRGGILVFSYCTKPSGIGCPGQAFCPSGGLAPDTCVPDCKTCANRLDTPITAISVNEVAFLANAPVNCQPTRRCVDFIAFYCPANNKCMLDCTTCNGYSIPNVASNLCERPGPETCMLSSVYCSVTDSCVDDCSQCGTNTVHMQNMCLDNPCGQGLVFCPATYSCLPSCDLCTDVSTGVVLSELRSDGGCQEAATAERQLFCPRTQTRSVANCQDCWPYTLPDQASGQCVPHNPTTCEAQDMLYCPLITIPGLDPTVTSGIGSLSGGCKPNCILCRGFPIESINTCQRDSCSALGPGWVRCPADGECVRSCDACSCFTEPVPEAYQCMEPEAVCALQRKRLCTNPTTVENLCVEDCIDCLGSPISRSSIANFFICMSCAEFDASGAPQTSCGKKFLKANGDPVPINTCIPQGSCSQLCRCDGCLPSVMYDCPILQKCVQDCAEECAPFSLVDQQSGFCMAPEGIPASQNGGVPPPVTPEPEPTGPEVETIIDLDVEFNNYNCAAEGGKCGEKH